MSASSERDIDNMTNQWGEEENEEIEREMAAAAQQPNSTSGPRPGDKMQDGTGYTDPADASDASKAITYTRYVSHYCPATRTTIGPLASTEPCPHCKATWPARAKVYLVQRHAMDGSIMSGDVFCHVTERWTMNVNGSSNEQERRYNLPRYFIHGEEFNFGYDGSGPADLALSILGDFFGEAPTKSEFCGGIAQCVNYHQSFKFYWVGYSKQHVEEFEISSVEIEHWLSLGAPYHK